MCLAKRNYENPHNPKLATHDNNIEMRVDFLV